MVAKRIEEKERRSKGGVTRLNAIEALVNLLTPIADFALDTGLSVREVKSIYQLTTVRLLAKRQVEEGQRHNISGIAATTGISRSEVSRLIKMPAAMQRQIADREGPPTRRVLAAWCSEPDFANSSGQPADLNVFGHRASFNSLVKRYGRGLPTRAMLDELVRAGAVEMIGEKAVRVKAQNAISREFNPNSVSEFGKKSAEFLVAMLSNVRNSRGRRILSHVNGPVASKEELRSLRREIAAWNQKIASGTKARISKSDARGNRVHSRRKTHSASLSVIYFDEPEAESRNGERGPPRRNLRRAI